MTDKQLKKLVSKASDEQGAQAHDISMFFPALERGHGHKRGPYAQPPVCRVAGCVRKNKQGELEYSLDHIRGRFGGALTYVLDVSGQTRES